MPRKLELTTCRQIVHTALGTFRPIESLVPKGALGDFIPNAAHRDQFRETVRKLVQEKHFDIHPAAIPILPHRTIEDIVHALTISALPGNVYTPVMHSKPPSPPSPKRKTPPPAEPSADIAFEPITIYLPGDAFLPGSPSLPGDGYAPKKKARAPSAPPPKPKTPPPSEPHRDFELPGTPSIPKPHKLPPKSPTPKPKAK
jgi:hypothetical protein